MLLRARVVLPVSGPPIENGAVSVAGNRIAKVGRWVDLRQELGPSQDLGDVILLPGLVNAHCHLDYTAMAGMLPPPRSFPDWIKSLLSIKSHWSYADYAQSWIAGSGMLVRSGTTTVADIEAVPELLPEVWTSTPLRVISFLEMTGVRSRRPADEIVWDAIEKIESVSSHKDSAGLSPHAPYSTSPQLLQHSADVARQRRWRVATHVSESEGEFDMFMYRRGELYEWLMEQRDMADCGHGSPLGHVARQGMLGDNFLAVHMNYLWDNDIRLLVDTGTHVVHCPRSHAYFGHRRFPRRELAAAGVNVALGTDSLVSTKRPMRGPLELDMFAEMRALAAGASDLSPQKILEMATVNGARALGMSGALGELREGALADIIAIPFAGGHGEPHDAIIHHTGAVCASLINGRWAVEPSAAA